MFDKISNSFALAGSSWRVLKTDKKLLIFPILSGIASLILILLFVIPLAMRPELLGGVNAQGANQGPHPLVYVFAGVTYFLLFFISIFFNAALVSCALIRFNGGEPTLGDGLSAAASRLPQIFAWALVSATVGLLLNAIENAHEKAGYWIRAILGAAW